VTGLWPHSVRWRLTLLFAAALGALLVASAAGSWYVLRRALDTRADRFLVEARDAFVVELRAERAMLPTTGAALAAAMRDIRFSDIEFVVLDEAGRVTASSGFPPLAGRAPATARVSRDGVARAVAAHPRDAELVTVAGPAGGWRVALREVRLDGAVHTVAAAQSRRWLRDTLEAVAAAYLAAVPILLAAAAAGGWLLAGRALGPVTQMSRRAREIGATTLHERLPVENPRDELGALATTINGLLARLEEAFERQRRFVADASHELRTPVAVVRAEAEVALARPTRPEAEYRDALTVVREAGERLSRVVDDMLLLAKADGRPVPLRREPLYLDELVTDTVRVVRALAARRSVRLEVGPLPEAPFAGDAELLGRLVLNLVDNAIKYSPMGGAVSVHLSRDDGSWVLRVADEGPGIPPEARDRVFERFYRAEASRVRDRGASATGGAGLGLAIARWIAEAHGGTLSLVRTSPAGSEFEARLPAAHDAAADGARLPALR